MSSRRTDDEQRNVVKNSHSSRENRRSGRRDGHQRPEKSRNDFDRRRSADDDQRRTDWHNERWRRDRDKHQQRQKRRERPTVTEEEGEQAPCDPDRPSWQNTKVRKHAEMLKERKLLWKGKSGSEQQQREGEEGETTKSDETKPVANELTAERKEKQLEHKWQSMIAATAQDTQQMNKFQRLMGMKKNTSGPTDATSSQQQNDAEAEASAPVHGPSPAPVPSDNAELNRERVRQMELQRGLNQQFELARQSHHCARGRGLGSF